MTPTEIVESKNIEQIISSHGESICDCCHSIHQAQDMYHHNEKLCFCCKKVSRIYLKIPYSNEARIKSKSNGN